MSTRNKNRNVTSSKARIINGSVIAVGSSTGKALINSNDSAKIMDAIKAIVSGGKSKPVSVKLSKETLKAVTKVAQAS